MSELLQGYKFVSVRNNWVEGESVWQDIPLKGIPPDASDTHPTFAYVSGERPLLGRVHTNFEGDRVTEIKLEDGYARVIR